MVVGFPPFLYQSKKKLIDEKLNPESLIFPSDISQELITFIGDLLEADPRKRLAWQNDFDEIRLHPWLIRNEPTEIGWDAMANPSNRVLFSNISPSLLENLQNTGEEFSCKIFSQDIERTYLSDLSSKNFSRHSTKLRSHDATSFSAIMRLHL